MNYFNHILPSALKFRRRRRWTPLAFREPWRPINYKLIALHMLDAYTGVGR